MPALEKSTASEFNHATATAWVRQFPNPDNLPYFSVASRTWHPRSYYDTNTRGCIIPDDVVHQDEINNDVFGGVDSKIVKVLQDCSKIEAAFCSYLSDINTESRYHRPCQNVYSLIDKVRFELETDDMKRCWKTMSIPEMMDDYFKVYESFMREVGNIVPLKERVIENTPNQLKIGNFTFDKIYVQG